MKIGQMPLLQVQLICSEGYALVVRTAVMNLISSPLSCQDTFFYGFSALEEMACEFHVCVHLCAHSPQPYLSWHIKRTHSCPLGGMRKTQCYCVQFWEHQLWERAANWRESRWSQGLAHVTLQDRLNWAYLGCSGDLIAVYIRVITEETEPDWPWGCPGKGQEPAVVAFCKGNCGLIAGRKVPYCLKIVCASDTGNKALRELIWLWSKTGFKQMGKTSGSYPLSWTPQVACVINCKIPFLFLNIFLLKFQACIK